MKNIIRIDFEIGRLNTEEKVERRKDMYKAKFGFEFDTEEKAKEFDDGAFVCFSGCRNINNPPDESCKICCLVNECIKCHENEENFE